MQKVHNYKIGDKVQIKSIGFLFPELYTITELMKRGRYRLNNGRVFKEDELYAPKTTL